MLKVGVKGIANAAVYAALYVLLREASVSHWLLTAGLRFAALVFLPSAYWPSIILGDLAGSLYYRAEKLDHFGLEWLLASTLGPIAAYAAPVYFVKESGWWADPTKLGTAVAQMLATGLVAAMLSAGMGIWALQLMKGVGPLPNPMSHYFALFTVGDYLGILVIAPLAFTAYPSVRRKLRLEREVQDPSSPGFAWAAFLCCGSFGVLYMTAMHGATEDAKSMARVAMLLPVILMTWRYGWFGAVPTVFLGNVALQATMTEVRSPDLVAIQFLMCLIGSAMLALAAIATEFRTANRALVGESHKHLELARTNLRWGEMRSLQSAMLLESAYATYDEARDETPRLGESKSPNELAQLRWNTGLTLRREVQRAVEALRLSTLHSNGLRVALMAGPIATTLDDAGVSMAIRVTGDTRSLPSDMHVLLYHMAHEFTTRLVREQKARRVRIRLVVGNDQRRSVALVVQAKRGSGPVPVVPPSLATSHEIRSIAETYRGIYHDRPRSKTPTLSLLIRDS